MLGSLRGVLGFGWYCTQHRGGFGWYCTIAAAAACHSFHPDVTPCLTLVQPTVNARQGCLLSTAGEERTAYMSYRRVHSILHSWQRGCIIVSQDIRDVRWCQQTSGNCHGLIVCGSHEWAPPSFGTNIGISTKSCAQPWQHLYHKGNYKQLLYNGRCGWSSKGGEDQECHELDFVDGIFNEKSGKFGLGQNWGVSRCDVKFEDGADKSKSRQRRLLFILQSIL